MNYRMLWISVAFVSSLFASQFAVAAYIAYAVGEQGKSPLPERVDDIETRHLLNIEWGENNGRKARLGVLEVDNNSGAGSFTISSSMGNAYESNTSGKGGGVGGLLTRNVPLLGGVKGGSSTGRVGLNIRLIDAETRVCGCLAGTEVSAASHSREFGRVIPARPAPSFPRKRESSWIKCLNTRSRRSNRVKHEAVSLYIWRGAGEVERA